MGCIAVAVLSCNLMLLVVGLFYKLILKKNIYSSFLSLMIYNFWNVLVVLMSSVF